MAHTTGLQGRLTGCGCHGAPSTCKPFTGHKICTRTSRAISRIDTQTQCAAVSNVKLPATHKEASQRALDQLRASSSIVNSTCFHCYSSSVVVLATSLQPQKLLLSAPAPCICATYRICDHDNYKHDLHQRTQTLSHCDRICYGEEKQYHSNRPYNPQYSSRNQREACHTRGTSFASWMSQYPVDVFAMCFGCVLSVL